MRSPQSVIAGARSAKWKEPPYRAGIVALARLSNVLVTSWEVVELLVGVENASPSRQVRLQELAKSIDRVEPV